MERRKSQPGTGHCPETQLGICQSQRQAPSITDLGLDPTPFPLAVGLCVLLCALAAQSETGQ